MISALSMIPPPSLLPRLSPCVCSSWFRRAAEEAEARRQEELRRRQVEQERKRAAEKKRSLSNLVSEKTRPLSNLVSEKKRSVSNLVSEKKRSVSNLVSEKKRSFSLLFLPPSPPLQSITLFPPSYAPSATIALTSLSRSKRTSSSGIDL